MTDLEPTGPAASDARSEARPVHPFLTAADLAASTGGTLLRSSDRPIVGAQVDSRLVEPGNLFVALPGEHTDGHRFVRAAVQAGAAGVLVSGPIEASADGGDDRSLEDRLGDVTVVLVPDTLRAMQQIARDWRRRFAPLVVGVTGSIAKTSTKEAIAAVLGRRFRTLKNEGNQNNEIGLPLTVLRLRETHDTAVLEMGMYVGGEIRDLAAIGRPQIGVVTAVQPVHLSRIGTIEAVERAKGELVEALPDARDGGVAVLNADDERVRRMATRTAARVVTYGFADDADVRATDVESAGVAGMRFVLRAGAGVREPVVIPNLGRLAVHNALAGATVGLAAGMAPGEVASALGEGWSAPHRTSVLHAGGVTIVDDTYNASPASVRAALELLAGLPGRRVAVLGEMLELGAEHEAGHESVGASAAACDLLVVVDGGPGGGASGIVAGAVGAGMSRDRVVPVADRDEALAVLLERLADGDAVLVKASRGVALDVLVDALVDGLRARRPNTAVAGREA
ncbi:MAG: UDP-N-acetylmuramoyl-tripeptide--D-alanyl-D-alanine ligase [Chloroflexota bacterium]